MARQAHKLTAAAVKAARRPGLHPDGAGLFLQVSLSRDGASRRSWLVRYTASDGKRREMGLGPIGEVDLATARELARDARIAARAGRDPISERRDRRAAATAAAARATASAALAEARAAKPGVMTFKDCADAYIAAHEAGWRNDKHRAQWRNTLQSYAYPLLGSLPAADVDQNAVMRVLDPIWNAKPETASRLRGRIEAVLDWAAVRGHRKGENPARWRGHLQMALPSRARIAPVRHHRALPHEDMPGVYTAIASRAGAGADCLRFLILTAARYSEAARMTWGEVDLARAIWTVPGKRMKSGREHRVPLSSAASDILKARLERIGGRPDPSALIFESDMREDAPISQATMMEVLRRIGRGETVHGFRSTFRDWAAECTSFPREVAEAALAHAIGDRTEAAYRRGDLLDKRRALMDGWAAYCTSRAKDCAA